MNDTERSIERLRKTLNRYNELVVEEANRYLDTTWLDAVRQPAPDLIPTETAEEVEAELLRFLEEQAHVRKELADELRKARLDSRA